MQYQGEAGGVLSLVFSHQLRNVNKQRSAVKGMCLGLSSDHDSRRMVFLALAISWYRLDIAHVA